MRSIPGLFRWALVALIICLAPASSWGKMVWYTAKDLIARADLIVIAKCIAKTSSGQAQVGLPDNLG